MPKKHRPQSLLLRGRLTSFNISPKGHLEGILLACADGTVQVNFDKDARGDASRWRERAKLAVRALLEESEHPPVTHAVYRLAPEEEATHGRVAGLNYARHGEVNGFVLDDGTFIHLKPAGARKHPVRVGDEVVVQGARRVGPAATVIDATDVTRSLEDVGAPGHSAGDARAGR